MNSRRFKYTHWLKISTEFEKMQWEKLKKYNDKYDCSMTVFYYDYNPLTDKIIKLDTNQSYDELDLDVDTKNEDSFKKVNAKPINSSPFNRSIYSFFEEYLDLKGYTHPARSNPYNDIKKEIFPAKILEDFPDLENVEVLDELIKRNNWELLKIKSTKGFQYQLYYGEGVQVDNKYEYAFSKFLPRSRVLDRFQRVINYEINRSKINWNKFIGHKLNFFSSNHELNTGDKIPIDANCIGVVLGINDGNIDLYDNKKPMKERFFSIKLKDFEKGVRNGIYKVNYNMQSNYEKLEIKRYLKNKLDKFARLCGDWDYRNIDMTMPHLQSIEIKGNNITINCEKYSTDLDEYVSCSNDAIADKDLVKKFKYLDLANSKKVLEFIKDIEQSVDFKDVEKRLNEEEQEEIKKIEHEEEEELDYEK